MLYRIKTNAPILIVYAVDGQRQMCSQANRRPQVACGFLLHVLPLAPDTSTSETHVVLEIYTLIVTSLEVETKHIDYYYYLHLISIIQLCILVYC